MQESVLRGYLGDQNVWEVDASVPVDAATTKVWFTLKRSSADEDAEAVKQYGANVSGLTGVNFTVPAEGKFQIVSPPGDLPVTMLDRALLFDCQIQLAGEQERTIARGHITLSQGITRQTV